MLKVVCVLLTIKYSLGGSADSVTDGTTLVQALIINRHGDRTPTSSSVLMSTNVEAVETISAHYGYGQLTEVGKRRAYSYGQYIRDRYDSLISKQYNRSEIYIRATDSTRAKMTVLTALAAVYPAYPGSWSKEINRVPVPYTTVPAKYDFNLAILNCPILMAAETSLLMSDNSRMDKYADVIGALDSSLADYPVAAAYSYYDIYKSQESLGVPLGHERAALMPQLKEAADEAIDIVYGDEDYIKFNGGVLLNEFFTYASSTIAGEDNPRLRIYSAHDVTVFGLMAAAQIADRQGVPKYAAAFSLELRKVYGTEKYVVLAVYKPEPSADLVYLQLAGCDSMLCDLDQYKELVSKYLLDEDTWRSECGFTEDLVVDDSSVA